MLVLFEGCDKAGKSTLIRDLKRAYPSVKIIKNIYKPELFQKAIRGSYIVGIYLGLYQMANDQNQVYLFDRSHFTELVYSKAIRGYDSHNFFDWDKYELTELTNALIVYTSAPIELLVERFNTEKEDYVSEEAIKPILEGYENELRRTNLPVIRFNSTTNRELNLFKLVDGIRKHGGNL